MAAPLGVRSVTPSSSSSGRGPAASPAGSTSTSWMLSDAAEMLDAEGAAEAPFPGSVSAASAAASACSRCGALMTSSNSPSRSMTALKDASDSSCAQAQRMNPSLRFSC